MGEEVVVVVVVVVVCVCVCVCVCVRVRACVRDSVYYALYNMCYGKTLCHSRDETH